MGLAALLDRLPESGAREALLRCCGSRRWAERMIAARPFSDDRAVIDAADQAWRALDRADRMEAFAAHPRIGDRDVRERWSRAEQSGVGSASDAVLAELEAGNTEYEKRFGHVFLICASGLSAEEMLRALRGRLENEPEVELEIASAEQAKITRLRLERLAAEKRSDP